MEDPDEIFYLVMGKSLDHGITINFLYPAVIRISEKATCNDDDIFKAYFASETKRLAGGPPTETRVVDTAESRVYDPRLFNLKAVTSYLQPDQQILSLHLDLYEKLIWIVIDIRTRFISIPGNNDINTIVRTLCYDIIQKIYARRPKLN